MNCNLGNTLILYHIFVLIIQTKLEYEELSTLHLGPKERKNVFEINSKVEVSEITLLHYRSNPQLWIRNKYTSNSF